MQSLHLLLYKPAVWSAMHHVSLRGVEVIRNLDVVVDTGVDHMAGVLRDKWKLSVMMQSYHSCRIHRD